MSRPAVIPGKVTRYQSGFYTILVEPGKTITCGLRGRLKRRTIQGDIIAVGDDVMISVLPEGSGMIEEILPRHSELVRMDPTPRGDFRQILLANHDQMLPVFACANPEPHVRMLDRFLVLSEKLNLKATIVINKIDLLDLESVQKRFAIYPQLGYRVIFTSAKNGLGIDELHDCLKGKLSALTGPSGVGKSSLLNAIQPGLGLAIREVSAFTNKGVHTTVVREMFPLVAGGFVADLPGIRRLALWDTEPEELDGYFPELRDLVMDCQFNDCTHRQEPGCAVIEAVHDGRVTPERYESYLRLRYGNEEI
jgi:ribosome biogenesis GTPase / thiamine phosphate phosphatase